MPSNSTGPMRALYCAKAHARYGYVVWADARGWPVQATCITDKPAVYREAWPNDTVEDRGVVLHHIQGQMTMNGDENRDVQRLRPSELTRNTSRARGTRKAK